MRVWLKVLAAEHEDRNLATLREPRGAALRVTGVWGRVVSHLI